MGTGKYRITKIARDWDENKKRIILKRIVSDGEVKYVNENDNVDIDITETYYRILSNNKAKFLGSMEQFIFKVNKMERNIENDCVIIKNYTEEEYKEFKEKNNEIFKKLIAVKEQGKEVKKEKICRKFYEKEKEIMEKRLKEAKSFNNIIFNICKEIFDLKYDNYSDEKNMKYFKRK